MIGSTSWFCTVNINIDYLVNRVGIFAGSRTMKALAVFTGLVAVVNGAYSGDIVQYW